MLAWIAARCLDTSRQRPSAIVAMIFSKLNRSIRSRCLAHRNQPQSDRLLVRSFLASPTGQWIANAAVSDDGHDAAALRSRVPGGMGLGSTGRQFRQSSAGIPLCSGSNSYSCSSDPRCANTRDRKSAIVPMPDRSRSSEPHLREPVRGLAGASKSLLMIVCWCRLRAQVVGTHARAE
jgi:hypothetical protein